MYKNIPAEMKQLNNWVCFKYAERNGKKTKIPVDPKTGNLAKSNDPHTWGSFAQAAAVADHSGFAGVGFMLDRSPFVGIDIDHCRDAAGNINPQALELIHRAASYAEISPSGTGVHIIMKGEIPDGRGRRNKALEMYDRGRFFTVTGNVLDGCEEIRDGQALINEIIARIDGERNRKGSERNPAPAATRPQAETAAPAPVDLVPDEEEARPAHKPLRGGFPGTDEEMIKKIRNSKQGPKFEALYDRGDTSAYGGDDSAADMALMNILSFWTGGDADRMERIFSASTLGQRDKWKSRADYRAWTVSRAVNDMAAVYEPNGSAPKIPEKVKKKFDGRAYTDKGMAERLLILYGDRLAYAPEVKSWYVYDGAAWRKSYEGRVYLFLYQTLAAASRSIEEKYDQIERENGGKLDMNTEKERARLRATLLKYENYGKSTNAVQAARALCAVSIDDFDRDPWRINCVNGVLNLKTLELEQHTPEQLMAKITAAEYRPGYASELWEKTVRDVLPDESTRRWIQKFIGYCLTGSVREEKFLFLYGPGGRGKGTFIETIADAMGDYAETIPIDLLLSRRNDAGSGNEATPELMKLAGVRMAITSEAGSGRRFNDAKLKLLTGGDKLTARALRCDPVTFDPHFKLVASSNYMPAVTDVLDEGIRRRLIIVPFEANIEGIRDLTLKERLRAPDVLAGVLSWAADGCRLWQREGLEPIPEEVKKRLFMYYDENDDVGDFIAECCKTGPQYSTPIKDLYAAFVNWLGVGGRYRPMSKKAFSQALASRGFPQHKDGKGTRRIVGLYGGYGAF